MGQMCTWNDTCLYLILDWLFCISIVPSALFCHDLWSLPSSSYATTKVSSVMPNTFGISLKISLIFLWNMSPAGAAPNGRHLYLYLPNWHVNVRYADFSPSFRLWHPELASIRERYFALLSFGRISFRVGPLCIGHISAWFRDAGSRHSLTLPLALGTSTKLLHHSNVSLTHQGCYDVLFLYPFYLLLEEFLKSICHMSWQCLEWFAVWL